MQSSPLSPILAISVGFIVLALFGRLLTKRERPYLALCMIGHFVGAVGLVWLTVSYYGYGDLRLFDMYGRRTALVLDASSIADPESYLAALNFESPTSAMISITGLIYVALGPSLTGACLLASVYAFAGQTLLYIVARDSVAASERQWALIGLLLVPSVVFWTSGVVKEGIALGSMGVACYGAHVLLNKRKARGAIVATIGVVGIAVVKPYILFPLVLSAGAWAWAARRRKRVQPVLLVLAAGASMAGIVGLGRMFPEYSPDELVDTVVMQQNAYAEGGDTSTVGLVNPGDSSIAGQLRNVPLALVNALARPALFDIRNGPTAIAALESTALTLIAISLMWRARLRVIRDTVSRSGPLMFSFVFVVLFALAVGLASPNLGTLSRYRVPMMPFYVFGLLLLRSRVLGRAKVVQPEVVKPPAD